MQYDRVFLSFQKSLELHCTTKDNRDSEIRQNSQQHSTDRWSIQLVIVNLLDTAIIDTHPHHFCYLHIANAIHFCHSSSNHDDRLSPTKTVTHTAKRTHHASQQLVKGLRGQGSGRVGSTRGLLVLEWCDTQEASDMRSVSRLRCLTTCQVCVSSKLLTQSQSTIRHWQIKPTCLVCAQTTFPQADRHR
jgi:hypothetical protein